MDIKEKYKVVIVGTGFSGICAAINLRKIGITDFTLLEKNAAMGGTWEANKYPGAAVDVKSYLYCYSFEPYDWSRVYAKQKEIFNYTNYVIDKHKLREQTQLNSKVVKQEYIDDRAVWQIHLENGDVIEAEYIFNSFGALVDPSFPKLEGMDTFKGAQFHSAQWDTNYDLKGKRVAIVGTAASAVQIIPAIVDKVGHMTVFQRTPHWVIPRPDREFTARERNLFSNKLFGWLYREFLYWSNESRMIGFAKFPKLMKHAEKFALSYLEKKVKSPELRKKLTPDFGFGCKRVLVTSDYYPALQKENVTVEADGIKAITEKGILLPNGSEIELDAIIYCTGFNVVNFVPFDLKGQNGTGIAEIFNEGMHAYLGTLIPKFPKMFLTLGPNTGVGHTSALHIMESQVGLAMKCIKESEQKKWKSFVINDKVEQQFNDDIQKKLQSTIWVKGGCKSWYQDKTGKNRIIFPDYNFKFRKLTTGFKFSNLNIEK